MRNQYSATKMDLLGAANWTLKKLPRLDALNDLDRLVLSLLVRREALQSSRMEGTFSTIEQALTPATQVDGKEKSARASDIAYAHTLEKYFKVGRAKGVGISTESLIRKMHPTFGL